MGVDNVKRNQFSRLSREIRDKIYRFAFKADAPTRLVHQEHVAEHHANQMSAAHDSRYSDLPVEVPSNHSTGF